MSADPGAKRCLWVPGAGAGPVPDGWAAAASAGLCVPGRGQRREEQRRCGAASGGCPGDPQGSGARGAAAFGGSAGWEPAVAWSRAPCALGCPSACDPFWCWGSWARLGHRGAEGPSLGVAPGLASAAKTGAGSFSFQLSPRKAAAGAPGGAPGSLGTGGAAGRAAAGRAAWSPGETGRETAPSPDSARRGTAPARRGPRCRGGHPGRVSSGARGRPASSVAGHHRPWGRVPRKTFRRGGGAASSLARSGRGCPHEVGCGPPRCQGPARLSRGCRTRCCGCRARRGAPR